MKTALVVGCSGQDGVYLVRQLEGLGYRVAGIDREVTRGLAGDRPFGIEDPLAVREAVAGLRPDEIYFLAAHHRSSEDPAAEDAELVRRSFEINTLALSHFLEAMAAAARHTRLFYAASSRVFGHPPAGLQDESTPMNPVDPYGISKAAGVHLCRYYRSQRGVYCSTGILYNHESPHRPEGFVSRKIVRAAVRISRQPRDKLVIGNLDARVDWGYAPDYVDAMWRILQLPDPDDFVISSGALHSVRELVEAAFEAVGLDWTRHVEVDPAVTRNGAGQSLQGNSAKLTSQTGWRASMTFTEMIRTLVAAEVENGR